MAPFWTKNKIKIKIKIKFLIIIKRELMIWRAKMQA
jgi:hypothetical protein